MSESEPNGWGEWSRHVLMELKRLNAAIEAMLNRAALTEKDISVLQSSLRNKNDKCAEHGAEIKEIRRSVQNNRDLILGHRLIGAIISAITAMVTAVLVAYFSMKGG